MLIQKIKEDITQAMLSKNSLRLETLRYALSALRNKAIELGKKEEELTDSEVLAVLEKQVKSRNESIEMFKKGNREDLVQKEEAQKEIIETYLPKKLSEEETAKIVKEAILATSAKEVGDLGKVMAFVKAKEVPVDMSLVGKIAKDLLVFGKN